MTVTVSRWAHPQIVDILNQIIDYINIRALFGYRQVSSKSGVTGRGDTQGTIRAPRSRVLDRASIGPDE